MSQVKKRQYHDYGYAAEREFIDYLGGWRNRDGRHKDEYAKQTDVEKLAKLERYLFSTTLRRDRPDHFGASVAYLKNKIRALRHKLESR